MIRNLLLYSTLVVGLCFGWPCPASHCPSDLEAAAEGVYLSTSSGPVLGDQLAYTLFFNRGEICGARDANKEGKCVLAMRTLQAVSGDFPEGLKLNQLHAVSFAQDRQFMVGVASEFTEGIVFLGDSPNSYPVARKKNSWGTTQSLEKEIARRLEGTYIPVENLDIDERIVAVKGALTAVTRNTDPILQDEKMRFVAGLHVYAFTNQGRLLSGRLYIERSRKDSKYTVRLRERFEPLPGNRWSQLFEPLGGATLVALTDEGVLYYVDGTQITKLSAVPGTAVALAGYSLPVDMFDNEPQSPQRFRMRVWVAAKSQPDDFGEVYELEKVGAPLKKTSYQVPAGEMIVSMAADAKYARHVQSVSEKGLLPAMDHYRRRVELENNKVRSTGSDREEPAQYYEKLLVATVRAAAKDENPTPKLHLRGLTDKNQLEFIPWFEVVKRRSKQQRARKPSSSQAAAHPDASELPLLKFSPEVLPKLAPYYTALGQKVELHRMYSEFPDLHFGLVRRTSDMLQALYRRIALYSTYRYQNSAGGWSSYFDSSLGTAASVLLMELVTLPDQDRSTTFVPLSATFLLASFTQWAHLLKTPLRDLFCEVPMGSEPLTQSGSGVYSPARLMTRVGWPELSQRMAKLYQEDTQAFQYALGALLFELSREHPNLALGDAVTQLLAAYDPLRGLYTMQNVREFVGQAQYMDSSESKTEIDPE